MESDSGSRGVLVHVAGFLLGSLGLFLSILTSAAHHFLGRDTLVALTRTLDHSDAERQELHRRPNSRHLKPSRATSPIPSISVTLHQTGNSIAHSVHSTHLSLGHPRPPPPPRRPTVNFSPAPTQPRLPSRRSSPALKDPQWLALPPIQTRSSSGKGGRRHTLNRARSSPQLTSFAAAGVSFSSILAATTAGSPRDAQAQSRPLGKETGEVGKEEVVKEKVEEWQSVYLSEEGSPTTTTATVTVATSDATSSLAPEVSTKPNPRPTLRKAKTLGDLLRRVPSAPGPSPLPISAQKLESTTKKAFAFTNSPKSKSKSSKASSSSDLDKEPKFTLSMKSPRYRSKSPDHNDRCRPGNWKSKEKSKERKRTQPYEAPYFWTPPDQAAAMGLNQQSSGDSGTPRGRKAGGPSNTDRGSGTARKGVLKSAPASRAVSPARNGEAA